MRLPMLILGMALALCGCEYIPGTDDHSRAEAEKLAARLLKDPASAQFRDLFVVREQNENGGSSRIVCGQINGRNSIGGYAGFFRFIVDIESKDAMIDPGVTATDGDVEKSDRLCKLSADTVCLRSDRLIEEISLQEGFEAVWAKFCEAAS